MKHFLFGVVATLVVIPPAGFFYIRSRYMPVAATDHPLPFERSLAGMALRAGVRLDAPKRDVSDFTTVDLVAGAGVFQKDGAFCHGLPQQPTSTAGSGMFPHAPQVFTAAANVSGDPADVTFWKVENGIRLTGMPSFKTTLTDQQMWQVSAEKLPPEVQDALKPATTAPTLSVAPGGPQT